MPVWEMLCAIGVVFWGVWSWGLKIALQREGHFAAVTLAASIGILVVACMGFMRFAPPLSLPSTPLVWGLVLLSGITGGAAQLFLCQALERGPVSVVIPLFAMSPMIAVMLGVAFLHDGLTHRQVLGAVLAFLSTIILSTEGKSDV